MANEYQVKPFLLIGLFVCCYFSCQRPDVLKSNVERMADLECRAITLREQRFALADSIRFAQDTLLRTKTIDSTRLKDKLHNFLEQKAKLLQVSLLLADTIHSKFDSLRKNVFNTLDDKKTFEQQLKETMEKRNCK